jgi:hypothetical protein
MAAMAAEGPAAKTAQPEGFDNPETMVKLAERERDLAIANATSLQHQPPILTETPDPRRSRSMTAEGSFRGSADRVPLRE